MGDLNSLSSLDSSFYSESKLAHIADSEPHDAKVQPNCVAVFAGCSCL
jgi:hypothetical protein